MSGQSPDEQKRLVDPSDDQDESLEVNLRPQMLTEFVGQNNLCKNLSVFVAAANKEAVFKLIISM